MSGQNGYDFVVETATPRTPLLKIGRKGTMQDDMIQNV